METKTIAHDSGIKDPAVVSREKWLSARTAFLAKEKEFTRLRDELSRERRELPWEGVDKKYVFEGSNGKQSLPELFEGRKQLIVYHFMFDPSWEEGCKSWGELMHRLKGYAEGKNPGPLWTA